MAPYPSTGTAQHNNAQKAPGTLREACCVNGVSTGGVSTGGVSAGDLPRRRMTIDPVRQLRDRASEIAAGLSAAQGQLRAHPRLRQHV
jgi:hypothetical protein